MDSQNYARPESGHFCAQDVLWAIGVWSAILILSPVVMFYMLMVN